MNKLILILSFPALLLAKTYMGCADTKKDALVELSSNIYVNVDSGVNTVQKSVRSNENEDVKSSIEAYSKVTTHLDLVNIKWKDANGTKCAFIEKEDQVKHTKALLDKVLLYDEKNLPVSLESRIDILKIWLSELKQIESVYPVFLDDVPNSDKLLILEKEKRFSDQHAKTLFQMDSLVWKACGRTKDEALENLNNKLFNKKKEEHSFFENIKKLVTENPFSSKKKDPLINLLEPQISYTNVNTDTCAVIQKESLLNLSKKMYADVERLDTSLLEQKDQIKRYKQIDNKIEMLRVSASLISLFPNEFSSVDKNSIDSKIKTLEELKKKTYPQFVLFHVQSETPVQIILDGKNVDKNKKLFIQEGDHAFSIKTENRCDITGDFSIDFFEEKTMEESFSSMHYPTVLFISDQEGVSAMVDGTAIAINKKVDFKKCSAEVVYLARLGSQSKTDKITLKPEGATVVELDFLSPQEMAVFSDAKSKKFATKQDEKFSESLTAVQSKKLKFRVESSPKHGSLDLDESGHFVYTPDKKYAGSDSFEYLIKTPDDTSSPRVVLIDIKQVQGSPAIKKVDENLTKPKEVKEELKKVQISDDQTYQKFKKYIEKLGQENNIEKINKLKEKYPDMFKKFIDEKLSH